MLDRLIREGNPPTERVASPVPQYWNPDTEEFEKIQGSDGASLTKSAMEYYGNGIPGAHAGEPVGAMYLDVTNGNIYASTGAAWVLKLEGIWD